MNESHNNDSLRGIQERMRIFAQERDWEQFHDPKSLILALVGEVGELAELFQWLPADQASSLAQQPELAQRVGEEMADVLLYLTRLADVVGVDLGEVTATKFMSVEQRFPAEQVKGDAPVKR
jgi:dCTP diphosphatase